MDPDNPRVTPDEVDTPMFDEGVEEPRYEGPEEDEEE